MRFVVRWLFRLLILLLVLVAGLLLLKDLILKELLQSQLRRETGLEVRLGRLELGLLSPTLTLEDLRLYNPPEFGGAVFLHVAEFHLEYDLAALQQRQLHLRLLRVNLAEATVVENPAGQSNLDFIGGRLRRKQAAAPKSELAFTGLDTLNLSLGRLNRVNLKNPTQVEVTNLGIRNEIYTNLRNQQDVLLALGRLVFKLGLSQFTNQMPVLPDASRLPGVINTQAVPRRPSPVPVPGR